MIEIEEDIKVLHYYKKNPCTMIQGFFYVGYFLLHSKKEIKYKSTALFLINCLHIKKLS
jgi:hypothetical protein